MNTQEKLTPGELETLKQLEQWIGEDNRFELPRPITNQLKINYYGNIAESKD